MTLFRIEGVAVDMLSALDAATDEFGRRLALVGEEEWSLPTPCAGWDVHYLAAHVIGGNRFADFILGGMTASDAIELVISSPQLGDDAIGGVGDDLCRPGLGLRGGHGVGAADRPSAR